MQKIIQYITFTVVFLALIFIKSNFFYDSIFKYNFVSDTIYSHKNYKLKLITLDARISEFNDMFNSLLIVEKNNQIIFSDTILKQKQNEIILEDYNGDGIEDFLIYFSSSARSNEYYKLYLVDTLKNKFTKIKGFDEIPNPKYISEYNIISNYALSGKNWSGFYKIQDDSIFDFNIYIEDDLSEESNYDIEYQKAIKKILKMK